MKESEKIFGAFETAWCPGCGNFPLLECLKETLVALGITPESLCVVSGIGQAAKTPHYLRCNAFNGLHGRSLPAAQGIKLANPFLTVIAESGDGCHYGEGGNHFLAAIRRDIDITMIVHNNQIYGLTKGQASPTTKKGQITKAQPRGNPMETFNPLAVAITMGAGFVARGFVGEANGLKEILEAAILHKGFSLVDVLQPCVSFNKINTYRWYKERCQPTKNHDPSDFRAALDLALTFGDEIPLGVLRKRDGFSPYPGPEKALALCRPDPDYLKKVLEGYL
ncbi:MAG: 2-oxoacid:ferredoxin oxidoreductase subunit beta [Desulfobacterales bacterium]|nr:2-oxoacid:ferredoxin oxidoreductase subunit beta [Desulfobacterales bacterium]